MANGDFVKGIVLGVAAAALTPVVLRALGVRGDTLATAAVRAGRMLSDKAKEVATEIGEIAEDAVAELQAGRYDDVVQAAGSPANDPASVDDVTTSRSA
jgi:hypothetical protein